MGEADFPRFRHVAAADQPGVGYAVMRPAELALDDERAVIEHSGYAEYLGRLQRFVKASGGRIPERRWASIVLPDPGGPIMRRLEVAYLVAF